MVTTRDSWKSRRHDFHDLESREAEITWFSREHEQTTQKWRLKRPTHGFCISTARHNMEKYNYVRPTMSRRVSLHICTCARSAMHDIIKTHTTRAHNLHDMKRMHHYCMVGHVTLQNCCTSVFIHTSSTILQCCMSYHAVSASVSVSVLSYWEQHSVNLHKI